MSFRRTALAEDNALKEKAPSFFQHLPAVWLLFVGLVLTAGAAAKTADWEKRQTAADFEKAADHVMDLLHEKMRSSLDVLLSVRSFYLASREMEYAEFEKFTAPLLEQHSEIYAVEWIPEIRGEDRELFEKEAALKLGREYTLRDQAPDGSFFPSVQRKQHYPVLFIQPLKGENLALPGLDYSSRPGRYKTMMEAAASRGPAMTDILELSRFRNMENPYGAMIFLPLLNEGPEAGEDRIKGFFSAVFHVGDVMEKALENSQTAGIALRVYSSSLEDAKQLIYEHASSARVFSEGGPGIEAVQRLEIAGKSWEVVLRPEAKYFSGKQRYDWIFILAVGILLSLFGSFYLYYFESVKHRRILRRLSLLDDMTALYNRRGLEFLAEEQFRLSRRNKTGLALYIADLNYLKQINDRFGHQEGDRAIKAAAHLMRKSFRDSDLVSRIGGDEFAVIAINADPNKLRLIVEKIQMAFAAYNKDRMHPYALTISVGFAYAAPGEDKGLDALMEEADKALYDSKIFKPSFEVHE